MKTLEHDLDETLRAHLESQMKDQESIARLWLATCAENLMLFEADIKAGVFRETGAPIAPIAIGMAGGWHYLMTGAQVGADRN